MIPVRRTRHKSFDASPRFASLAFGARLWGSLLAAIPAGWSGDRPTTLGLLAAISVVGTRGSVGTRIILLPLVWILLIGSIVQADESLDRRFLDGLRQRQLFSLAEKYCTERLEAPNLSDSRRVEMVIELSHTLSDRAVNSEPSARGPLWQRAWDVTDQFARQSPENPHLTQVRLQGVLAHLARGELSRQESEVIGSNREILEEARSSLREAITQLEALAQQIESQLQLLSRPDRFGDGTTEHITTERQLDSMKKHVEYQLARAYRNQALCYPSESLDRVNALIQAVKLLGPLSGLDASYSISWESRLDEIVCRRLLGDWKIALNLLERLVAEEPAPGVLLRAHAERIQLALDQRNLPQAIAHLEKVRRIEGVTSGALDFAWLETYLEAWKAAEEKNDAPSSSSWRKKADAMLDEIRSRHGPYWTRRARMLMASCVQDSTEDADILEQAAENYYHSGQYADALARYDRARALAEQQGNLPLAFKLGKTAAAIEFKRGQLEDALLRHEQLALGMPSHREAPSVHLTAIHIAGKLAAARPDEPPVRYAAALEKHLETWLQSPTSNKARWWLGRLREYQSDWQNALAAYTKISPDDPQMPEVIEAVWRCYRTWLSELKAAGKSTESIAQAAAIWFESLVHELNRDAAKRWNPTVCQATLAAAQMRLDYTSNGFDPARKLLSNALDGATGATPQWQSTARAMLVFSLAGQGRRQEAANILQQISAGPPQQLFEMLDGLADVAKTTGSTGRKELASLQLHTVELLGSRRKELSPTQQRKLDRIGAQALADAGRTAEAKDAFRQLAARYPLDGPVQEAYARLLSSGEDRASLDAALAQWRMIEKKSPEGTARWFEAKYEMAALHCRFGKRQEVVRAIQFLKILHPELGGPERKAQFEKLLERCRPPSD